jgi:L-asparagine transporter-like permease
MMRMLLRRIHNKLLYAEVNIRRCRMKKADVDFIFRKHHLKFSYKLILFVTFIVAMGMYFDASHSTITLGIIGVVIPLLLILFKNIITDLFTTENVDE